MSDDHSPATADLLRPLLLEGRTALVTGGTGGIGQACVRRLHDYGATVAATFLPGTKSAQTVAEMFPDLKRVTAYPLDLRGLGVRPGMLG